MDRRLGRSGDERERVAYQVDGVNRKMNSGESREEDAVISVLSFQSDTFSKSRIQRIDFTAIPAPCILSLLIPWHSDTRRMLPGIEVGVFHRVCGDFPKHCLKLS
jgi:hypothetical protein